MTRTLDPECIQTNRVTRLSSGFNLRLNLRMIQALQSLPVSPLVNQILNPKVDEYQLPIVTNLGNYPLVTNVRKVHFFFFQSFVLRYFLFPMSTLIGQVKSKTVGSCSQNNWSGCSKASENMSHSRSTGYWKIKSHCQSCNSDTLRRWQTSYEESNENIALRTFECGYWWNRFKTFENKTDFQCVLLRFPCRIEWFIIQYKNLLNLQNRVIALKWYA